MPATAATVDGMETLGQIVRRDGVVLDARGNTTRATLTDDGRRVYRALAYDTSSEDRHGTQIDPAAFRAPDMANFPVILFHDQERLPVGRVTEWQITEQGPVAGFVFADTAEAREAELLVATGFLNGVSIGFIGWDLESRSGVPTYIDVEVVELSLTPTPSSRGALINLERSIRSLEATIEGDVTTSEPSDEADSTEIADSAETRDVHCECCALRFKTGELVHDTPAEETADEVEEAATVASEESRIIRLTSLLNRLR
jgi:phage head maturation protease